MKTTLVRAFVLVLAVAGFGASTVSASGPAKAGVSAANVIPIPMCPLSDPTHCGLD